MTLQRELLTLCLNFGLPSSFHRQFTVITKKIWLKEVRNPKTENGRIFGNSLSTSSTYTLRTVTHTIHERYIFSSDSTSNWAFSQIRIHLSIFSPLPLIQVASVVNPTYVEHLEQFFSPPNETYDSPIQVCADPHLSDHCSSDCCFLTCWYLFSSDSVNFGIINVGTYLFRSSASVNFGILYHMSEFNSPDIFSYFFMKNTTR